MLAQGQVWFFELTTDGDDVLWSEFRSAEAGRVAVMRWRDGHVSEMAPGFNARTLVHEYGGASVVAEDGAVYASRFGDQRMYRIDLSEPEPITPVPSKPGGLRYADGVLADGRIVAVCEDHSDPGEPTNGLVMFPVDGSEGIVRLVTGRDFVSTPRVGPDGRTLAWLAWDHPNMPWMETELWVAELEATEIRSPRKITGVPGESFFQPVWSPAGDLFVVADRSGWWNVYRVEGDALVAVAPTDREIGLPGWQFGIRTAAFLPDGRLVTAVADRGLWSIEVEGRRLDLGDRHAYGGLLAVAGGRIWTVLGAPSESLALLAIDPNSGEVEEVRRSSEVTIDARFVSHPTPVEFPTSDGVTAHAFYYPPTNPQYEAPAEELPPLVVWSHGGPTAQTQAALNLGIQFWTTRGFAVVDVNYRGSTGFGRAYRDALRERWGDADVVDCVNAARYLASRGLVDGARMAIRGASAGGYVTLCALVFHDVFAAGTSYAGVADIKGLMGTTHKLESRYDSSLIGPYPEAAQQYHDRSPINFADRVSCPVLIIQGSEDPIVTPDQAEVFVEAMRANGLPHAYLLIEGEDHFLAKADTIVEARSAELSFYAQIFGFKPAGEISRLAIAGLP